MQMLVFVKMARFDSILKSIFKTKKVHMVKLTKKRFNVFDVRARVTGESNGINLAICCAECRQVFTI